MAYVLSREPGAGAFDAISGEVVKPVLAVAQFETSPMTTFMLNAIAPKGATEKSVFLREESPSQIPQSAQLKNPDHRILFDLLPDLPPLSDVAKSYTGTQTGEDSRFKRCFWEMPTISKDGLAFRLGLTVVGSVGNANTSPSGNRVRALWRRVKAAPFGGGPPGAAKALSFRRSAP